MQKEGQKQGWVNCNYFLLITLCCNQITGLYKQTSANVIMLMRNKDNDSEL